MNAVLWSIFLFEVYVNNSYIVVDHKTGVHLILKLAVSFWVELYLKFRVICEIEKKALRNFSVFYFSGKELYSTLRRLRTLKVFKEGR